MLSPMSPSDSPLAREVEDRVRSMTHNRVRELTVRESEGCVEIRGRVPSHHTRQLALHAALESVPAEACRSLITVE